jgi:hypothetical protein
MTSHKHWVKAQTGNWLSADCYASHPPKKVDWKGYLITFLAGGLIFGIFLTLANAALRANGL